LDAAISHEGSIDVELHLGIAPPSQNEISAQPETLFFVSSDLVDSGEPSLRIWKVMDGAFLRMDYFDGMQFWLKPDGTEIWGRWPEGCSLNVAAMYLMGPVLGVVLRLRGITCLHASAVAFGDRGVAFVGDQGAGKSTTAAAFARRGHDVLSDDIVTIVERGGAFYVMPAYPYLSLWPDSVEMLFGSEKSLPSLSETVEKRMVSLPTNHLRLAEQPLPLAAIFLLGERSSDPAAPLLEAPTPSECLMSLVANSYATRILNEEMRAREFALLGRMLLAVPVRRLRPPADPSRINVLCDRVDAAFRDLQVHPLLARQLA